MKIKVLIIDKSAVMRKLIADILIKSKALEVTGAAMDSYIAVNKINKLEPKVLVMNLNIFSCQGIEYLLGEIVKYALPAVILMSEKDNSHIAMINYLRAERREQLDIPDFKNPWDVKKFSKSLVEKIKYLKEKNPGKIIHKKKIPFTPTKKYSPDVIIKKLNTRHISPDAERIIAIGASTGGAGLIEHILCNLPDTLPGIVIVIHMPEKFTRNYAERINLKCSIEIKEALSGDMVTPGTALIGRGNRHLLLRRGLKGYFVEVVDGKAVNRHKPSIDVLFRSVSQAAGEKGIGILCTGMGYDGAMGLLEMKETGALTIAQDEASSIVFGMPREAIALDAAKMVLNTEEIIGFLKSL